MWHVNRPWTTWTCRVRGICILSIPDVFEYIGMISKRVSGYGQLKCMQPYFAYFYIFLWFCHVKSNIFKFFFYAKTYQTYVLKNIWFTNTYKYFKIKIMFCCFTFRSVWCIKLLFELFRSCVKVERYLLKRSCLQSHNVFGKFHCILSREHHRNRSHCISLTQITWL